MSAMGAELNINTEDDRVELTGDIDAHTAPALDQAIGVALARNATITLSMAGVGFIDSSGMRVVISRTKAARAADGDVVLSQPSNSVARLIEVSGLADQLTIQP